jgi:mannose/fructose/N-acetylgalactosamine-specific phosphotransferase system component IIB
MRCALRRTDSTVRGDGAKGRNQTVVQERLPVVIAFIRVDSRLIHGQVIEAWLPHLNVERILVADDIAATDPLVRTAIGLAVPPNVEVVLAKLADVDFRRFENDAVRTLVLLRDIPSAMLAYEQGLIGPLNLGNVHDGPLRHAVSRSVYLTASEREQLLQLTRDGLAITIQAVPAESPRPLS